MNGLTWRDPQPWGTEAGVDAGASGDSRDDTPSLSHRRPQGTNQDGTPNSAQRTDSDIVLAWTLGYDSRSIGEDALAAIDDARLAEIPIPRLSKQERIAQRVALFEQHAQRVNEALGRPPGWRYNGGPVDFDTGRTESLAERTARRLGVSL